MSELFKTIKNFMFPKIPEKPISDKEFAKRRMKSIERITRNILLKDRP